MPLGSALEVGNSPGEERTGDEVYLPGTSTEFRTGIRKQRLELMLSDLRI